MKVAQLLEAEDELPTALDMLQLLLKKGEPVLLAFVQDGEVGVRQIVHATLAGRFTAGAGAKLAGTTYTSIETRGEGFCSWKGPALGIGHGSISIPV